MKKEYLIYKLSEDMKDCTRIDNELFPKYDVKRGLRNEDGTGVLVGLTKVGNVVGYERIPGGGLKPIPGKLFYRQYDLEDLAHAAMKEKRYGFEEVAYLLLSGRLPDKEEHEFYNTLEKKDRKKVKRLAGILKICDGLDRGHLNLVKKIKINFDEDNNIVEFILTPNTPEFRPDISSAVRKRDLFEIGFKCQSIIKFSE